MCPHVLCQGTRLSETLSTLMTVIRILPNLYPHLLLEHIGLSKSFVTLLVKNVTSFYSSFFTITLSGPMKKNHLCQVWKLIFECYCLNSGLSHNLRPRINYSHVWSEKIIVKASELSAAILPATTRQPFLCVRCTMFNHIVWGEQCSITLSDPMEQQFICVRYDN